MRVVDKTKALGALAGVPRACNESGSAQRVTSGTKVSTAARGRQIARPRSPRFDRTLSWQLDAALFLEENAGGRFERWLARSAPAAVGGPLARVGAMSEAQRQEIAVENIPAELKQGRHWLCWRLEQVKDRWTKVPYRPFGPLRKARSNDPGTWGSFEQALALLAEPPGYHRHRDRVRR